MPSLNSYQSLPYAYPCDNYMDKILSNVLVRKTVDRFCKEQISKIREEAIPVTAVSFPRLYKIFSQCCGSLQMDVPHEVYVTGKLSGINALSIGTDKEPIILISRKAIVSLSDEELKFMIGHELGHVLQKNLMCHTIKGMMDALSDYSEVLGTAITDLIGVPLNQWYRCSEYTSDRAGFICCRGDMRAVRSLFAKLSSDSRGEDPYMNFVELDMAHPLYGHRIKELETYKFNCQ